MRRYWLSPGDRAKRYKMSADELCTMLMAELFRHLFSKCDPKRPERPQMLIENGIALRINRFWANMGKIAVVKTGPAPVLVLVSPQDEVLDRLEQGSLRIRDEAFEEFMDTLKHTVGEQATWNDYCEEVVALPLDSQARFNMLYLCRLVMHLDLALAIIVDMRGDRVEKIMVSLPGDESDKPMATRRLLKLTKAWMIRIELIQKGCKLLDMHYQEPPGSAFKRLYRFIQYLARLANLER